MKKKTRETERKKHYKQLKQDKADLNHIQVHVDTLDQ